MRAKRITVYLDGDTFEQLEALSVSKNTPVSRLSADLIRKRLEDQEELYFAKIAEKIREENTEWIRHEDVKW